VLASHSLHEGKSVRGTVLLWPIIIIIIEVWQLLLLLLKLIDDSTIEFCRGITVVKYSFNSLTKLSLFPQNYNIGNDTANWRKRRLRSYFESASSSEFTFTFIVTFIVPVFVPGRYEN